MTGPGTGMGRGLLNGLRHCRTYALALCMMLYDRPWIQNAQPLTNLCGQACDNSGGSASSRRTLCVQRVLVCRDWCRWCCRRLCTDRAKETPLAAVGLSGYVSVSVSAGGIWVQAQQYQHFPKVFPKETNPNSKIKKSENPET